VAFSYVVLSKEAGAENRLRTDRVPPLRGMSCKPFLGRGECRFNFPTLHRLGGRGAELLVFLINYRFSFIGEAIKIPKDNSRTNRYL
jgi:hypothetical protein